MRDSLPRLWRYTNLLLTYLLNKSDWRPTAAVIPTYCVLEFNMNRRIRNKSHEEAKIRDILRPGKAQAGTRDTEAEIRDVPGNTGRLASLVFGAYKIWHTLALLHGHATDTSYTYFSASHSEVWHKY